MTISVDDQEYDDEPVAVPQTDQARATATLGITIVESGRQAWPKFEYADAPLPDEDAISLITRVNDIALKGLYDIADQGRNLLKQVIEEEKNERKNK